MEILQNMFESLQVNLPSFGAIALAIVILFLLNLIINKRLEKKPGQKFRSQLFTLIILFVGLLIVILLLPISDTIRGQLLSLIGILLSAAIALSSATLVGNMMAGLMLRVVKSFRPGDFIQVGEHFGRVSERGLLHVEIQTEQRDLTTLPNLYLASNPVKVTRASGTFVTAEVSLGYDQSHLRIADLLKEAALAAELEEPFVHVMQLGDFAVTYRVSALLKEVKKILTARSRLKEMMLDKLHEAGVEIVSPTFMNTRALAPEKRFIPQWQPVRPDKEEQVAKPKPEKLQFDKAEEAESLSRLQERYEEYGGELKTLEEELDKTDSEIRQATIKEKIEKTKGWRERLLKVIKAREEEKKD